MCAVRTYYRACRAESNSETVSADNLLILSLTLSAALVSCEAHVDVVDGGEAPKSAEELKDGLASRISAVDRTRAQSLRLRTFVIFA